MATVLVGGAVGLLGLMTPVTLNTMKPSSHLSNPQTSKVGLTFDATGRRQTAKCREAKSVPSKIPATTSDEVDLHFTDSVSSALIGMFTHT